MAFNRTSSTCLRQWRRPVWAVVIAGAVGLPLAASPRPPQASASPQAGTTVPPTSQPVTGQAAGQAVIPAPPIGGPAGQQTPQPALPARTTVIPLHGTTVEAARADILNGATVSMFTYSTTSTRDGVSYSGTLVGASPFTSPNTSTSVPTKIIPLIIHMVADGTTWDPTLGDPCAAAPLAGTSDLTLFQNSPIILSHAYTMNGVSVGTTQYVDAFQRANFWSLAGGQNYHVLLSPTTLTAQTVNVPSGKGQSLNFGSACQTLGIVDVSWMQTYLEGTLIPSLAAQGVSSTTFPVFLIGNVVMASPFVVGTDDNCCILGYHSAFGSPVQTYGISDFDTTGLFGSGTADTSVAAHEVGEWMNDPLTTNPVPSWGEIGQVGGCQGNLEVGDPLSGTLFPNVTMPNGYAYHLQELAFYSWFLGSPALGAGGKFSNNGTFVGQAHSPCGPGGTNAAPPSITTQPANQTIGSGSTATMSVVASSSTGATLSYQWYVGTSGILTSLIGGATLSSYTTPALSSTTSYWVRVKDTNGTAYSKTATMSPPAAPVITLQPSNMAVTSGASAGFTVAAGGNPAPTYEWQVSTNAGATWTNLTNVAPYNNVTTTTLTVAATAGLNGNQYRVVATNAFSPSATSSAATLTVFGAATASPSPLYFGATKAGAGGALTNVTPTQSVTVSFAGASTGWTASANQPWVQLTGGVGAGNGTFTVAITNPSNVIAGSTSLSATITLTAPNAPNSPVTMPVTLTVDQTGNSEPPAFGQVDTPTQNITGVQGALAVTGWAVDAVGVASVKIYRTCFNFDIQANCVNVNGDIVVYVGDASIIAGARPDVEAAYPTYPASNTAGWGFLILTNLLPDVPNQTSAGGQGTFTFYVYATDIEGHITRLGRSVNDTTPTTATMANDSIAKPFGAIDTPTQGGTVSGASFANFGWVITPDPGSGVLMPIDGSTIIVYVDGAPIGSVSYNNCRGTVGNPVPGGTYCNDDIASIFGNATPQPTFTTRTSNPSHFRNLDVTRGAIGALVFDTTAMTNGVHTIQWGATDSASRPEGIGSRYFTVLNAGSGTVPDRAALEAAPGQSRGSASLLADVAPAAAQVVGRTGFDPATPFETITPTADGHVTAQIPELGRIELRLGSAMDQGYHVANADLRDLPPGSHLDPATGQFTWAPGPGYLGTYHFAFLHGGQQVPVDITIRPMTSVADGTSQIRMNADLPVDGATIHRPVTIAGWALDPQAWTGAGIGAVHVWAFRRDAPSMGPQFLGTATLGLARPDIANAFGAQFGSAGFSLTTTGLAPGEYDIVAYAWCDRTQQFEDARTVRVRVR